MAELVVEKRRVTKLRPHPHNSRVHSKDQIAKIWESITRFGFNNPILVDEDGVVLAGHGRLAAAKFGKMTEIPVVVIRGLSEAEKRAYIIADNRIAEESEWDKDKLIAEVQYLADQDFDIGFLDLGSLDEDLANLGDNQDRETPEDKRDREDSKKRKPKPEEGDEGGDPAKDKDSINFPLYVVLSPVLYKEWKGIKGSLSDKQVITKLIAHKAEIAAILSRSDT